MPDYMKNVLDASPDEIVWYFSFISFTAPLSGVIVGGIITSKFGGYNTVSSQKFQCYMGVCAMLSCLPCPFISEIKYFGTCIWLLLFFGGIMLPPVTGIMLNSVEDNQKTSANSLANMSYNMVGYMPAPFFYGFISLWTGGPSSRWPMGFLLYSSIFTMLLLVVALR
mmetsp:Transcript_29990/g.45857  ORF Transcript_29990/g.45857 Transcript_29990/m.45857 type:complete len:167 (+) Transcript_29990:1500-2000(+)